MLEYRTVFGPGCDSDSTYAADLKRAVHMSSTLKVTRRVPKVVIGGIELRRGRFDVEVDGTIVASVDHNETIETTVEAGRHNLRIRKSRYSSQTRSFEVADGGTVEFRCNGARIWPTYVLSLMKPDLAIALHEE